MLNILTSDLETIELRAGSPTEQLLTKYQIAELTDGQLVTTGQAQASDFYFKTLTFMVTLESQDALNDFIDFMLEYAGTTVTYAIDATPSISAMLTSDMFEFTQIARSATCGVFTTSLSLTMSVSL